MLGDISTLKPETIFLTSVYDLFCFMVVSARHSEKRIKGDFWAAC